MWFRDTRLLHDFNVVDTMLDGAASNLWSRCWTLSLKNTKLGKPKSNKSNVGGILNESLRIYLPFRFYVNLKSFRNHFHVSKSASWTVFILENENDSLDVFNWRKFCSCKIWKTEKFLNFLIVRYLLHFVPIRKKVALQTDGRLRRRQPIDSWICAKKLNCATLWHISKAT